MGMQSSATASAAAGTINSTSFLTRMPASLLSTNLAIARACA